VLAASGDAAQASFAYMENIMGFIQFDSAIGDLRLRKDTIIAYCDAGIGIGGEPNEVCVYVSPPIGGSDTIRAKLSLAEFEALLLGS